jgi:hypothetical protein
MTSHELARQLLEGPDIPVVTDKFEEGGIPIVYPKDTDQISIRSAKARLFSDEDNEKLKQSQDRYATFEELRPRLRLTDVLYLS